MSTTAGQVIDKVCSRLEEESADPIFWSRSELLTLLNDAILEFTLIAIQLTSERTYAMISSKLQSVPDGAIAVLHVATSSKFVEKTTVEAMDRNNAGWDSLSGVLRQWAPCGTDRFFIDRHPTAAANVTLTTLDMPVALEEASTIDLDDEYIEGLEDYVFHDARFKEGGQEFADAMPEYDSFRKKAGMVEQRTFTEMWEIWSQKPAADTGPGYSTLNRGASTNVNTGQ